MKLRNKIKTVEKWGGFINLLFYNLSCLINHVRTMPCSAFRDSIREVQSVGYNTTLSLAL